MIKKALFITESYPYPVKNGVDLPISKIIDEIKENVHVDVLITGKDRNVSSYDEVGKVFFVKGKKTNIFNKLQKIYSELIDGMPYFVHSLNEYDEKDLSVISGYYDYIWCNLYGDYLLGCELKKRMKGQPNLVITINDCISYYYKKDFTNKLLFGIDVKAFIRYIRAEAIKKFEKKIFAKIDYLCVQTEVEKNRFNEFIEYDDINKILVVGNGKKRYLKNCYDSQGFNSILLMTHLEGGRKNESKWFLEKVWPLILNKCNNVRLKIIGTPPENKNIQYYKKIKNLDLLGRVDELKMWLTKCDLMVIPTKHDSGWINRFSDAAIAGMPIVCCKGPESAFTKDPDNEGVFATDNAIEFAQYCCMLILDKMLRENKSKEIQRLSDSILDWRENKEAIKKILR